MTETLVLVALSAIAGGAIGFILGYRKGMSDATRAVETFRRDRFGGPPT